MSEQIKEKNGMGCAREQFKEANSFESARDVVWNTSVWHNMYQHYTTLSRLIPKMIERRWWLTRSSSVKLNDLQEVKKFGVRSVAKRTYQASFVHSSGESAAMWGLYALKDPYALRISISKRAMEAWMKEICFPAKDAKVCESKMNELWLGCDYVSNNSNENRKLKKSVEFVQFHDLIYAAVENSERSSFDIRRTNVLFWNDAKFRGDKISDFKEQVQDPAMTGWIKDYEWRYENESRLCVRLSKAVEKDSIWIAIPPYVLADMRFTFSPWLPNDHFERVVEVLKALQAKAIEDYKHAKKEPGVKLPAIRQRFRRSVLSGALNFN